MANKKKKLKCNWNKDMALDLSLYRNIDAEAELTAMLSEEIEKEMIKRYPLKQRKIIEINSSYE